MKSFTQFISEKKNSNKKGNTSGTKSTKGSGSGNIGGTENKFRSTSGKVDTNTVRQTTSQVADTATNTPQGQKAFRDALKDSEGVSSPTSAQKTKVKAKLDRYVQKDLFGDGAEKLKDRINPNQRYSRPATRGWTGGVEQPATKVSGKSFDQLKKEIDSKVDRRSTNKPPQGTQFKRTKGGALATKQDLTPPSFKPSNNKTVVKDLKKNNKNFKKIFKDSLKTAKDSKVLNKGAKTFQKFANNPAVKGITKVGGKLTGPAFAALDVKGEYDAAKEQGRTNRGALTKAGVKVGAGYAGWAAGAKAGAATGAALGSFFPGPGTAIGGAIGGIAGGLTGYWAGSKLAGSTYDKIAGPTQKQKDAVANAQVAITKAKEKKKLKTGVYLNTGKYS